MTGTWFTVLSAVLAVFLALGAGAFLRWMNWLTEEADRSLMAVVMRVLVPCLILKTLLGNPALLKPSNLFWPPLAGIGLLLLSFAVAGLWSRWAPRPFRPEEPRARRTFTLTAGIQNYYYIPFPLAKLLFPNDSALLAVLTIYMVAAELGMWTIGILVLTGSLDKGWWKRALNPPAISVVAGVLLTLLYASPLIPAAAKGGIDRLIHFAAPVHTAMSMLGDCAIPMALLLIGAMVTDNLRDLRGADWRRSGAVVAGACVVRLAILPALFLLAARYLPIPLELKCVIVLQAAMPSAMFPIVLSRFYDGDPPTALRVVIGTSLAGLVTIPLWISVGMAWLG